jgi:hypothetical protein
MTTGSEITAAGLKTIQDKAELILGTGTGSRGYGQTVLSADYSPGTEIRKAQWDALRFDIINIRLHQDGMIPAIPQVNTGDLITFGPGSPNSNYNSLLETAIANRFQIGPGQSLASSIATRTYTSGWSSSASCVLTATFANSNDARYFFNSGGKVRINSTKVGGSDTVQNSYWTSLLNSLGTKEFGAVTDSSVNFYTLTNSYQTFFQSFSTYVYASNSYKLEAKCNVADNSGGTATVIDIRVSLNDAYTDLGLPPPGDLVDGTLTIGFEELKASGTMAPSGSFTITSPTYSVSVITAS